MGIHHGPHHSAKWHPGHHRRAFQKDLTATALMWLTLGGIMGSGLFLASGLAIHTAGPVALGFFALGVVAMYLEIHALAEMSIASPTPGSFLVYTDQVLGPGWTFVAGWIFWFSSVLTMSSEVTAAALFTRLWFPGVALWIWSLIYSAIIIGMNFLSVRGFGTIEGIMAGVKVSAVLAFVVVGVAWFLHWLPITPAYAHHGLTPILSHGGWLPYGIWHAAPAMLLVLFAYAGTGVIGLAAAEAKRPQRTIPYAIRASVILIVIMYLGSIYLILAMVPWTHLTPSTSPFILALRATRLPYAPTLMNIVLLFAVLSTMNAALYSNVRVLYSLSQSHQAPRWLSHLDRHGQPNWAIWTSAGLLALTILLAYVLPHKAYSYLVTATGFQAMFIWLMVLLTQLYYRPYLAKHHPERLTNKLWGYPYTTIGVMVFVVVALLLSPLAHGEMVGAIVGLGGIVVTWLLWMALRNKLGHQPPPA